jgi:hypothetical protein
MHLTPGDDKKKNARPARVPASLPLSMLAEVERQLGMRASIGDLNQRRGQEMIEEGGRQDLEP